MAKKQARAPFMLFVVEEEDSDGNKDYLAFDSELKAVNYAQDGIGEPATVFIFHQADVVRRKLVLAEAK
jgi:hypothetical protein